MHRVLSIVEILRTVFDFLDEPCNARNARVCKNWTSVALDHVWADGEPDVFRSLCPMHVTESTPVDDEDGITKTLTFSRRPLLNDWVPFLANASRVRTWHDRSSTFDYKLSREAIADIGITRPTTPIFPNLSGMWIGTDELEPFFMGESVKHLDVVVRHVPEEDVAESRTTWVFQNVADRLPHLSELYIGYLDDDTPNYDGQIMALLDNLPKLQKLTLPIMCLNTRIAFTLANHQDLHTIKLDVETPITFYTCSQDARVMFSRALPLPNGAFPSLHTIEFSSPNLDDASSFLFQPESPLRNLKQLSVHTRTVPFSEEIGRFTTKLATECPGLNGLSLAFHALKYDDGAQLVSTPTLEFQDFAIVSQLNSLTSLTIRHPHPIDMNDEDVAHLAKGCPHLRALYLNPYPVATTRPRSTLLALKHLADHCSDLKSVGIYVDGTVTVPAIPPLPRRLSVALTLGHSPIPTDREACNTRYPRMARFLANVIRQPYQWEWEDVEFVAEVTDRQSWLPELTESHDLDDFERSWRVVSAMTTIVSSDMETFWARVGGELVVWKKRCAILKAENAKLRAENEVLSRRDEPS